MVFEVGNGESSPRITIPRLTDGAWIQEIAARWLDAQCRKGLAWTRSDLEHFELGVLVGKTTLVVRVAEERDFRSRIQQPVKGLRRGEDIFIFILKRAMHEHNAFRFVRALRQSCEPGEVIRLELRACPVYGGLCHGVEIICNHQARDGLIVIPANGLRAHLAQARRNFIWIGTVADDVTEADGKIPPVLGSIKDRVECRGVRVQVAENENPHPLFTGKNDLEYR